LVLSTACRPVGRETTLLAIRKLTPTSRHAHQFFCCDFLHDLDLEVAFSNQLLQPRILIRTYPVDKAPELRPAMSAYLD
jgi:hypothetical protein